MDNLVAILDLYLGGSSIARHKCCRVSNLDERAQSHDALLSEPRQFASMSVFLLRSSARGSRTRANPQSNSYGDGSSRDALVFSANC